MVTDKKLGNANRKLDRQKKAAMRMSERLLEDPNDAVAEFWLRYHKAQIVKLKAKKARLSLTAVQQS